MRDNEVPTRAARRGYPAMPGRGLYRCSATSSLTSRRRWSRWFERRCDALVRGCRAGPERELAQRAVWAGSQRTRCSSIATGSFTFIGTVFTDLELPVDEPSHPTIAEPAVAAWTLAPPVPLRRHVCSMPVAASRTSRLSNRALSTKRTSHDRRVIFGCDCARRSAVESQVRRECGEPRFALGPPHQPDPQQMTGLDGRSFQKRYGTRRSRESAPRTSRAMPGRSWST